MPLTCPLRLSQEFISPASTAKGGASHAVDGRDPHHPTILGKLLVKPSEVVHFVKAAELVTKAVSEDKGSLVYGFSKTLTDDVTFYSCAFSAACTYMCISVQHRSFCASLACCSASPRRSLRTSP